MSEPEPTATQPGKLLSVLGVAFGLAGSVGGTIGAGILRTPGLVAAQLHTPSVVLLAWLVGGLYALLGAICIAELAASLPRAGGWYVYAEQAFGRRAGWLVGWTDWLAHCIGLAWVATTVGELLAEWIPANTAATWQGRALALLVLGLFSAVQLLGVRAGGASQELLSLVKAVAFLGLAAASFALPPVVPAVSTAADPADLLQQGPAVAIGAVLALQAVITTFDGWASPVYFAEEFSDPSRDLPRSLIGGVLAVLALYLLINAALLHVLPIGVLSEANLPAADAARSVLGQRGGQVISAVALISLLGLINTVVMAAPRILFGLSRDQLMPAALSGVNPGGTPTAALVLTSGCAAVLVLAGSFDHLLGMGAFLYVALPLSGIAAQLWLRRQQPELPRPFLSWGYPLTPWLVGAGSLAFLIGAMVSDTADSLLALALVGAGGIAGESWQRLQPKAGS
ncbi:APC family permease [Vulcanococcus sp. Clear-D1]|uniref:APC family permease n=1 Tax=Vulcanococcus sp. Clear-D1 TaxID=2766970 RepID=UPI0019C2C175|nr:APC family permease [Vulcanococcus sp. Clear-D1]MBD1194219.1 APC family permease [Vulcanococcus sp. Clear-D1]